MTPGSMLNKVITVSKFVQTDLSDFCVQVTNHTYEVETDTFKLRNIMEAPLLKFKEEIEV